MQVVMIEAEGALGPDPIESWSKQQNTIMANSFCQGPSYDMDRGTNPVSVDRITLVQKKILGMTVIGVYMLMLPNATLRSDTCVQMFTAGVRLPCPSAIRPEARPASHRVLPVSGNRMSDARVPFVLVLTV